MMKKRMKAAAAAAMALAMLCGALPAVPGGAELLNTPLTAHAAGSVTPDKETGVLTLSGAVTKEQIWKYREPEYEPWIDGVCPVWKVKSVVANNTYINSMSYTLGGTVELADSLSAVIYVDVSNDVKTAVLEGVSGKKTRTDPKPLSADLYKGYVKLVYPVNATEARRKITLRLYDEDGKQMQLYNSDLRRAANDTISFSVQDYLDQAPTYYPNNEKAQKLAAALGNYCNAASNYFCEKYYTVEGIGDVTLDTFAPYNKPLNGAKLSLILNSRLELRLFTDSAVPGTIHAAQGILADCQVKCNKKHQSGTNRQGIFWVEH